jgi:dihydroneopterin aldolase
MKKSKQLFPIKIACKKWLDTKKIEDEIDYKRLKALTKTEVRNRHRKSWETFITQLETDLNRVRTKAFKILNHMRKYVKESVKITCCSKKKFLKY